MGRPLCRQPPLRDDHWKLEHGLPSPCDEFDWLWPKALAPTLRRHELVVVRLVHVPTLDMYGA
ncbi:hypothetical protein [Mumia zhuanghuii]|uniref:Uncharacterized protein n=1 Tax=Mumia zhuanghuii TaxID=2585211 RepID=A0A5C4LVD5_9ACTN|nr:hypothetical protein [Mumia zhuanghuii]TNC22044.1 hypothetical protein FHE65_36225 [Mumia zhuanghuii]TNC22179.1 hypothetical protein FHE65_35870 [Mumia zhuanghuii]